MTAESICSLWTQRACGFTGHPVVEPAAEVEQVPELEGSIGTSAAVYVKDLLHPLGIEVAQRVNGGRLQSLLEVVCQVPSKPVGYGSTESLLRPPNDLF